MQDILSTKFWAFEPGFFHRTSELVMHRLRQGQDLSVLQTLGDKEALHTEDPAGIKTEDGYVLKKAVQVSAGITMEYDYDIRCYVYELDDGSRVARIPMVGSLTKRGDLCAYGSKHLTEKLMAADINKKIDAIMLYVDGPGGSVSGTTELGLAVSQSTKPVIAFVDEMAASAHYWVTSQADYIVGNANEYTQVGSIGTLCMLLSEREWLAKEGYEVRIMRAEQSTDKARLNSVEEWPEEELKKLQIELNSITDDFIGAVRAGRGDRLADASDSIFTGKMYELSDALDLGMVDSYGVVGDAIHLAADVAKSRKKNVTN